MKKLVRLTFETPYDLHTEFKAATAIKGVKMNQIVHGFMRAYLSKNRDQLDRLIELYVNKGEKGEE